MALVGGKLRRKLRDVVDIICVCRPTEQQAHCNGSGQRLTTAAHIMASAAQLDCSRCDLETSDTYTLELNHSQAGSVAHLPHSTIVNGW